MDSYFFEFPGGSILLRSRSVCSFVMAQQDVFLSNVALLTGEFAFPSKSPKSVDLSEILLTSC